MRRIFLTSENIAETAGIAAGIIRGGGLVLYPTDTLYGLGVSVLDTAALEKLYAVKGRDGSKPVHMIVAPLSAIEPYAVITPSIRRLADAFLPGALTIIAARAPSSPLPKQVALAGDTLKCWEYELGFRIPNNPFCLALAQELAVPYTATSANKSGRASPLEVDTILAQLGPHAEMLDLVVDGGTLPPSQPSTIVDMTTDPPRMLREGAIPTKDIFAALGYS